MNERRTEGIRATGTVIKAKLGNKDMLVVEVNAKKYPYKKFKWGKWNFKISNIQYFETAIREGSIVEGDLFDYMFYDRGSEPTRFHMLKVIKF